MISSHTLSVFWVVGSTDSMTSRQLLQEVSSAVLFTTTFSPAVFRTTSDVSSSRVTSTFTRRYNRNIRRRRLDLAITCGHFAHNNKNQGKLLNISKRRRLRSLWGPHGSSQCTFPCFIPCPGCSVSFRVIQTAFKEDSIYFWAFGWK